MINCKAELKLNWTKCCVLSAAGNDNDNDGDHNIFTIKDTKLYVLVVTLTGRGNQKLSKLLGKGFQRSVYWNEYNIKHENKNTPNEYRYFLESNFVRVNRHVNRIFVLVYTNEGDNAKRFKTRQNYW